MPKEKMLVHIADDFTITYCGESVRFIDTWEGIKKTCKECLSIQLEKDKYKSINKNWDF